jgi:hypothetical protein
MNLGGAFRDSTLGQNTFIAPNLIMQSLHNKSHFKAATSFLLGKEGSLDIKPTELKEVFSNIS